MRTTVAIDDELLACARVRARERGQTMGQLLEQALRCELARDHASSAGPAIPVFSRGRGPREGIDLSSNRAMLEALDEELSLDRRR